MVNPFDAMSVHECKIEITISNQTQLQIITAPRFVIEQQFVQLCMSAAKENTPIKVRLSMAVECHSQFSDKIVSNENYIEFKNKAYVDNEDN